jgi:antitoxin (DNA-binding transcriptional repressor) of toxin-antitoxin stability system
VVVVKTVNIRALKDRLSALLRDVQRGDVLLVTDRSRVVAEIRKPTMSGAALDLAGERLMRLAEAGEVRLGLPNGPEAYAPSSVRLPAQIIDDALDWTRGDR